MSATLAGLASFLLPIALDFLLKWLRSGQSEAALKKEGAREADDAANKESQDATERMSRANAEPHGRTDAVERLRDGSF